MRHHPVFVLQLSKPIKAEEGKELGLVDEIVPQKELLKAARKVALDLASGRRPVIKSLERNDKLEELDDALEIIKFARKQARSTAPNVSHPQACLDAMEAGVRHGGYEGNRKVRDILVILCALPVFALVDEMSPCCICLLAQLVSWESNEIHL